MKLLYVWICNCGRASRDTYTQQLPAKKSFNRHQKTCDGTGQGSVHPMPLPKPDPATVGPPDNRIRSEWALRRLHPPPYRSNRPHQQERTPTINA